MKSNIDEDYVIERRERIGFQLKRVREIKGLTMDQLADTMGINKSTISKIEAGKWNFGIDTLIQFAYALDLNIDNLFLEYKLQEQILSWGKANAGTSFIVLHRDIPLFIAKPIIKQIAEEKGCRSVITEESETGMMVKFEALTAK